MVAVKQIPYNDEHIYVFVGGDWRAFKDATNNYWWIFASEFEHIKRLLKVRYNVTLTKKWYHVQRLRGIV